MIDLRPLVAMAWIGIVGILGCLVAAAFMLLTGCSSATRTAATAGAGAADAVCDALAASPEPAWVSIACVIEHVLADGTRAVVRVTRPIVPDAGPPADVVIAPVEP